MTDEFRTQLNRRTLIQGAIASAAMLSSAGALAAGNASKLKAIKRAVDAGFDSSLRRIQDWIRLPTVAAEQLNIEQGADYMAQLATEAGFRKVRKVATGGSPAVLGVLDVGAKRTVGLYFMYDVKQFDEPNWTSPPLEPMFFDHPQGRALRGRGVINHKGPEATFLAAIHAFHAAGVQLPVNLVLLAEGEEEIGSPNFTNVLKDAEVLSEMRRSRRSPASCTRHRSISERYGLHYQNLVCHAGSRARNCGVNSRAQCDFLVKRERRMRLPND